MKHPIILILLLSIFVFSCKKDTTEEPQTEEENYFVLKLKNKPNSEHVILLFETRFGNDFMDVSEKAWSENHLLWETPLQQNDSLFMKFSGEEDFFCEYRLGVITPEGLIVNLDDQEGYTYANYPHFTWSNKDTVSLNLTIVTDNTGYVFIRDY